MAQLKNTVVSGSLRATDTLYAETGQFKKLNIPATSNGTTYGPGTNEQIIKSNGNSVYWATADSAISAGSTSTNVTTSGAVANFVEGKGYAFNNEIASVQTSAIASKAYAVNDILIYNNQLYKVTTAISSGGVITPNSNCVAITLNDVMIKNSDLVTTTTDGIMSAEDKEKLDNENKAVYKTIANQTIASFDDGVEGAYLKNCIVNIESKQDLHGYDKPWPKASTINMLPSPVDGTYKNGGVTAVVENGEITLSGTTTGIVEINIPLTSSIYVTAGMYIHLLNTVATNISVQFDLSTDPDNTGSWSTTNVINKIFSLRFTNVNWDRIHLYIAANVTLSGTMSPMLCADDTYHEFIPCSNICPITGWTGAKIYHNGENTSNPTVYDITFPSEAETVYGGTLTINSDGNGELVVTKKILYMEDLADASFTSVTTSNDVTRFWIYDAQSLTYNHEIKSDFLYQVSTTPGKGEAYTISTYSSSIQIGMPSALVGTTLEDIKAYFKTNKNHTDNYLILDLKEPTTYSLTSSQIKTLFGINTIQSDAGKITITYPANLTGYVNIIDNNLNNNYVKNTDYATSTEPGVIKVSSGLQMSNGGLRTYQATTSNIKGGTTTYRPIVPNTQHLAVFYGLAKAAGDTTQASSSNAVGTYTESAIKAILHMLGIDTIIGNYQADAAADKAYAIGDLFMYNGKLYKATNAISLGGVISPETNCTQTTLINGFINADQEAY